MSAGGTIVSVPSTRADLRLHFDQLLSCVQIDDATARESLVNDLLDVVPRRAFDPVEPSDEGMLFFHSEIEEQHVVPLQQQLLRTHLNLALDKPVTLFLSSVGGNVFAGLALGFDDHLAAPARPASKRAHRRRCDEHG